MTAATRTPRPRATPDGIGSPPPAALSIENDAIPPKKSRNPPRMATPKARAIHALRVASGDRLNQPRSTTSRYIPFWVSARVVAKWFFSSERRMSSPRAKSPS